MTSKGSKCPKTALPSDSKCSQVVTTNSKLDIAKRKQRLEVSEELDAVENDNDDDLKSEDVVEEKVDNTDIILSLLKDVLRFLDKRLGGEDLTEVAEEVRISLMEQIKFLLRRSTEQKHPVSPKPSQTPLPDPPTIQDDGHYDLVFRESASSNDEESIYDTVDPVDNSDEDFEKVEPSKPIEEPCVVDFQLRSKDEKFSSWLWRKEGIFKRTRYWAVIDQQKLVLFADPKDKIEQDCVDLKGASIKEDKKATKFTIVMDGNDKNKQTKQEYETENKDNSEGWIEVLKASIDLNRKSSIEVLQDELSLKLDSIRSSIEGDNNHGNVLIANDENEDLVMEDNYDVPPRLSKPVFPSPVTEYKPFNPESAQRTSKRFDPNAFSNRNSLKSKKERGYEEHKKSYSEHNGFNGRESLNISLDDFPPPPPPEMFLETAQKTQKSPLSKKAPPIPPPRKFSQEPSKIDSSTKKIPENDLKYRKEVNNNTKYEMKVSAKDIKNKKNSLNEVDAKAHHEMNLANELKRVFSYRETLVSDLPEEELPVTEFQEDSPRLKENSEKPAISLKKSSILEENHAVPLTKPAISARKPSLPRKPKMMPKPQSPKESFAGQNLLKPTSGRSWELPRNPYLDQDKGSCKFEAVIGQFGRGSGKFGRSSGTFCEVSDKFGEMSGKFGSISGGITPRKSFLHGMMASGETENVHSLKGW